MVTVPTTPETPENPKKTLKCLIPLKRSLKYPEIRMVPEKYEQNARKNWCLVRNDCSGSHILDYIIKISEDKYRYFKCNLK